LALAATLALRGTEGTDVILVCLISKQTQVTHFGWVKAKRLWSDPQLPVEV
jgi:hypothetical protein